MHYHITNTFARLSAFGLSWASHLTGLCDWRQTDAVVAYDVASVHITSFVSLSYVVFGMLIITSGWIQLL
jgi:hypothetical protein